jgi:hyperosmotically inducible periplasmic protein
MIEVRWTGLGTHIALRSEEFGADYFGFRRDDIQNGGDMSGDQIRITIATVVLAAAAGACDTTATNTNATNVNNANKNTVIVTNANNSNATANTNKSDRDMTRADFDKQKDKYAKEAKDAGRKIGAGADDLWIWTKTRAALAAADDLRDSTISVDVDNNVVTLTGSVANAAQKTKAQTVAQEIEGTKSVKNQLTVGASTTNANNANKKAT